MPLIFMSLLQKVVWNTAVQFAGKAVSLALAVIALGLLMRYLGQQQFGWYTTVTSFLQIFGIVADFGLVVVTAQMLTEYAHDEKRVFENLLTFRIASAVAIIGIAPLIVLLFPYNAAIKWGVLLATAAFLSIAFQQIFTGLFQRNLTMRFTVLAELTARVVLIAGIWFVAHNNLGFFAALCVIVLSQVTQLLMCALYARANLTFSFGFSKDIWRQIILHTWPITVGLLLNVVYLRGDILILSLVRSQSEVGIYGAAYRVLDIITQVPIMFMGVILPIITTAWLQRDMSRLTHILLHSAKFLILLAAPIIVGGVLLATPIMTLVGGAEFEQAGGIARILFLALIGGFMGALYGHAVVALGAQKQSLWVYGGVALIAIVGYLFAIPRFGVWGAAWVTVITETCAGMLLWRLVIRKTLAHTPVAAHTVKVVCATVCMGIVIVILRDTHVLIRIVSGALFYTLAAYVFGAITRNDVARLLKRV